MSYMAIYNTHPNIASINGEGETAIAWDKDGNVVPINQSLVEAEVIRLEAERVANEESMKAAKQSALNKLMALGLTEEEALALGVR